LSRIGEGVFVWDTDTGKLVRRLPDGHLLVAAAAISPDGRRVVLAGWDVSDSSGDLRLYDTDSGQQVARLAGHRDQATALSFSPDGRWIASSGDNTVRLWDAHAGCQRRCLSVFRSSPQHLVCLSDTSVIVAPSLTTEGRHDAVVLWGTREAEAEFDATAKRAFSEAVEQRREGELCAIGVPPVTALSYLPDGQRLACTCRDGGVRILDPALARPVAEFEGHPYVPIAIAAAPDGRWMVTADHAGAGLPDDRRAPGSTPADAKEPPTGSRLIVWDVEQGREIRRIQVPDAFVEQVGISPAGDRLLTYGSPLASDGFGPDRRVAMIQIWNASTGARLSNFEVPNRGITVRFCEDGKQVFLATSEGLLGTWVASTGTGQRPVDLKTSVTCCAVFPDGRRVLLGNSVGCLANCLVSTGKGSVIKAHGFAPNSPRADRRRSSTTPDAPDAMEEGRPVEHVALLANGKRALTCGDDGTIAVWDLASQKELSRCKHDYDIHVLAVSPDGTTAATATSEDTVVVWGLPRPAIRAQ
jgi:WD40 repeat protein